MTLYITYGSYASLYLEINHELGLRPILKKEKYRNETIIHGPYTQIIFTPKYKHKE